MGSDDRVTDTGRLASAPHSTCGLDTYFEAAKCLSRCRISEQSLEDYQRIVHINHQLAVALCVSLMLVIAAIVALAVLCRLAQSQASSKAGEARISARASPHKITVVAAPVENRAQPSNPAPTDANGASAPKRGKSNIIREFTPGSSSNTAQAQAQSASAHADTDLPLATHESQPDGINEIIIDNNTHPEGTTQNAPGPKRGSHNPLHQSSPPVSDRTGLTFFQAGFYRPVTLLGQFTATFIRHWPIPRLGRRPLLHSLLGHGPTLSIFAVAGDDAERDLKALHHALMRPYSASVRFVSLSRELTLDNIEAEIKKLYDECEGIPDTHLFIYLTGHGNQHNRMIVSKSKSISETYLFELLSGPTIPVTVLFDICRKGRVPSAIPPKGISLIWTSSVGETAGACRVPDSNSPDSCFLIALMISARTASLRYTTEALKETVQERLDQLLDYLKEVYSMRHPMERCSTCSDALEPCDKPARQNIDWGDAENIDGLLELTKILSGSDIAEEVYQRFMGDAIFLRVNKLPDPKRLRSIGIEDVGGKPGLSPAVAVTSCLALDFSPLPEDHTGKHERGANEPVHAGSTPTRG